MTFLCETKQNEGFAKTMRRRLTMEQRFCLVNLVGQKGGLLLMWSSQVNIHSIVNTEFSIAVNFDYDGDDRVWGIFYYASNDEVIGDQQSEYLRNRKNAWVQVGFWKVILMIY